MQASQLLYSSLTHMEEHITQSLRDLLNALYRTCCDEEQVVASNVSYHTAVSTHGVRIYWVLVLYSGTDENLSALTYSLHM